MILQTQLTTTHFKTAKEALKFDNKSLVNIKKNHGEIRTNAFIASILSNLVMSFNVGKTMNEYQLADAVNLVKNEYYFLKPSELQYCFNQAKLGRYGQLYDRIDVSVIVNFIEKYLEERMNVVIEENTNKNKEYNSGVMDEKVVEKLKALLNSVNTEKKPEPKQTEAEIDVFKGFVDEFGKLALRSEIEGANGRFVDYKGKILNVDEYCRMRYKEL